MNKTKRNAVNKTIAYKHASDPLDRLIYERHVYIKHVLIAKKVNKMIIVLNTGNTLSLNLSDFPRLKTATEKQLSKWKIISHGIGVHWEDLDEDLSLKGFITSIKPVERKTVIKKLERNEEMIFA